jgi:hypothetical protein
VQKFKKNRNRLKNSGAANPMTIGRKPKAIHLRIVDGSHRNTRHGSQERARRLVAKTAKAFGKIAMPEYFKGHAREAWESYIVPCGWLDRSREPAAIMLCELWAEFRFDPPNFKKHSTLRGYMSDLGLTDERNRGGKFIKNFIEEENDEHFGE